MGSKFLFDHLATQRIARKIEITLTIFDCNFVTFNICN